MTEKAWNKYGNGHDLRVFHEFVSRELGWNFEVEWEEKKDMHAAERVRYRGTLTNSS
jgi:hypothetical protein